MGMGRVSPLELLLAQLLAAAAAAPAAAPAVGCFVWLLGNGT